MEGAYVFRVSALFIMHYIHYTIIFYFPSFFRAYITSASPYSFSSHHTSSMPIYFSNFLHYLNSYY